MIVLIPSSPPKKELLRGSHVCHQPRTGWSPWTEKQRLSGLKDIEFTRPSVEDPSRNQWISPEHMKNQPAKQCSSPAKKLDVNSKKLDFTSKQ